ncbi:transcription initiation factor IID, 18kD subunit-domain-containing protein [Microdochium trichocladiopsis]|uniref:Transcription initiation factor TFIID subunit 13 n=1 Tax=Microdochium trichocladiopsis TaxID=1682393 RepID=A0A9P8XVZ1_9PEZI|nr:transcription initiation factor IID, 18kD subunit-domain-containing protein [Microdochium trichocladiopsis]KAH7021185.1 transcription initiation factor IID, 18kD subunit-domain-containing protein [Microdochium trichocladiopsis]
MEPRARAGKNVGKETFNPKEVANLLFAYGDVEKPLPETVRVADEIVTEFLEGVCFEASRRAQVAGRQKLKFDDFEFALRHSPAYLGKVRNMIDKRQHINKMRKTFNQDDDTLAKEAERAGKNGAANGASGGAGLEDELLEGLSDEDDIAKPSVAGSAKGGAAGPKKKKRKREPVD